MMPTLTEQIKGQARVLGFDAVGVARTSLPPHFSGNPESRNSSSLSSSLWGTLNKWLSEGYHGTMAWLAKDPYRRSHPEEVLPGCNSLVVVGMNYGPQEELPDRPDIGRIARYAWGKDYHHILLPKLKELEKTIQRLSPHARTKSYVDTGPVMEKAWAQEAGLGWIGKHTNLVSYEYGSWLVLGEILTTAILEVDEPGTDLCGSCSLCIQACPTQAIVDPYVLDAGRCISYLTIESRGTFADIPPELQKGMGNKIFGCDDCLEICPFNVHAQPTREPAFSPLPLTKQSELRHLSTMTQEEFQAHTQESPIRRAKWKGFMRNVSTALHNTRFPQNERTSISTQ